MWKMNSILRNPSARLFDAILPGAALYQSLAMTESECSLQFDNLSPG
jgi:hypothetical protein